MHPRLGVQARGVGRAGPTGETELQSVGFLTFGSPPEVHLGDTGHFGGGNSGKCGTGPTRGGRGTPRTDFGQGPLLFYAVAAVVALIAY